MNLQAVAEILDKMHERISIIECMAEKAQGKSMLGVRIQTETVKSISAITENEELKTTKLESESNDEEWAQILSQIINEKIKEIIRKTYMKEPGYPLTEKECLSIFQKLIKNR